MENTQLIHLQSDFDSKVEEVKKFTAKMNENKKLIKDNLLSWTGGIVGIFARMRDDKKIRTFLETPIFDGKTYQQLAEQMETYTESLAIIHKQVQGYLCKEDPLYYGNVHKIIDVMNECHKAWFNMAPMVANESMNGKITGTTLSEYVQMSMAQHIKVMDLPSDL